MKNQNPLSSVVKKTLLKNKAVTVFAILVIVLSIVTALFPPLVLEKIINNLTSQKNISVYIVLLYFMLIAVSGIFESAQNVMITIFGQKITHGLRSALSEKLTKLPASYFTKNEPGKITSRFVNDVDVVDSLFTNGIVSMVADCFKVISIIVVIFYKSLGLGLLMIFVTPLLFLMTRLFQKKMLKSQIQNRVAVAKVNNHVPETIKNLRMIHNLFREKYMEEKYDNYIEESYKATDKSNLYDSIYSPIIIFISSVVIAVMMVLASLGGNIQSFFGLSVGTAVAIIAYVNKVFEPLESIGMEIQNIQSALAGVKRINEFLNEEERRTSAIKTNANVTPSENTSCLNFTNVDFAYDEKNKVLNNLSFSINKGEAVTFVGRTGAGKSTIFKLILGLYFPQKGAIKINGVDSINIPDDSKRKIFGYVEQSFHLVDGTLAEQISLFDKSISQEQIESAAKLVGLHENILSLEKGYQTPSEKISFSYGQFQLLSIARAVVAEPQILLLDEITANLDSATEERVLAALKKACEGRTVVSISHRMNGKLSNERLIKI